MQQIRSENQIQADCVAWFNNTYCLKHHIPRCAIFSVPNGGTRNKIEALTLKATGMKAGVSDIIILLPNICLFIEFKTETGVQSEVQKQFETTVTALGFRYSIIRSLKDFKQLITQYI